MTDSNCVPQKVGVFGGAFDPPHRGHVALASDAISQLGLNVLHIIPTGGAWHKTRALSAGTHRLEMARLAFSGLGEALIDARELNRAGPSFTVETLLELKSEYPGADFYLLIGQDQAQTLQSWHRIHEILELAIICVAERANQTRAGSQFEEYFPSQGKFLPLQMAPDSVSATEIRQAVAHHQNVTPLVFEPVARYIEQHHLYQST